MKTIAYKLKGLVVSNDDKQMLDFWGVECVCPEDIENWLNTDDDKTLYINSPGGSIVAGADIYHMIKGKADTVITGIAASIASVIATGGKTVKMNPTAQFMIHNVSAMVDGDYRKFNQMAKNLEELNGSIRAAYKLKTNLDDKELIKMMDAETWFTAETAKAKGFVDEILFSENQQVSFDFRNAYKASMQLYNCYLPNEKIEMPQAFDFSIYKSKIQNNINRRNLLQ